MDIITASIINPYERADEVRETANAPQISLSTLRKRLCEAGIYGRRPAKKNYLTDVRRAERLRFAREHIHYTSEFWRKVIWSDEKTFSTDGYSPQWVHRLTGGRYEPCNLARSRHSTRKTINVWGCVTFHGPGVLHRINGRLNMHSYMDILTNQLVPFARKMFPLPDNEDPDLRELPENHQQYRFFMHDG
ncbi:hypothetical protein GHT06_005147 [Daphnia sinensis]|uniref:Transposase Tc1-like domain-containing protein n=1 Tax=Daphnia sinensis TaxID=1820382 RepID=A0AAD5KVH8_9CRUS|nr:hypothetical protein GHT06_005147 [Daphnia sinensis]